jgi:Tfp pilus assembly protein PilF
VSSKKAKSPPPPARPDRLTPLAVAGLTFAAFLPALRASFINWDDDSNFLLNAHYRGFTAPNLHWMLTAVHNAHYHPLTWLTLAFDYSLWGMEPFGYHLTSLLLHAVNAALFYFVCRRLLALADPAGPDLRLPAAFGALLFGLHPLRVESVVWISERRDVLSGLFYLLTVLAYLRAQAAPPGAERRRRLGLAVGAYALSLLSKAIGVTMPAVLLILDFYPLRRFTSSPARPGTSARELLLEKIPFAVLALAAGAMGFLGVAPAGASLAAGAHPLDARLAVASYGTVFYLCKTVLPRRLLPLYLMPLKLDAWSPPFLSSMAAAGALTAFFLSLRRRWPAGSAVWAFYLAALFPVVGLVQFGVQLAADRYTYLSCLGWALLAAGGLRALPAKSSARSAVLLASGLLLLGLGALTWRQAQRWHDSETLWRYVLSVDPENSFAQNNLGMIVLNRGDSAEAADHFSAAVRANPRLPVPHVNLANALVGRGELDSAKEHYREALRLDPENEEAHFNLANVLLTRGAYAEAAEHYRRALSLKPAPETHFQLGSALMLAGRLDEAAQEYRAAADLKPDYAQAHYNLGVILAQQKKTAPANAAYARALSARPDWPEASVNLAIGLIDAGDRPGALDVLQRGLSLRPDHAGMLHVQALIRRRSP